MSGTSWIDLGYREETLRRNLLALATARPDLARVLESAGVHESIVVTATSSGPRIERRFRGQLIRVQEDAEDLLTGATEIAGVPESRNEFLSGLGLGERVDALLAGLSEGGSLFVHEADPALMTLALAARDWSEALATGRLVLMLGAGLRRLRLLPIRRAWLHPRLETLMTWDRRHLRRRLAAQDATAGSPPVTAGQTAVVLLGELLQEESAAAIEAQGFDVYRLDPDAQTPEQIARELALLEPAFAFSINFRPELGSLGGRFGFPYICWEIDPTASTLPTLRRGDRAREACRIFTWRRRRVALFEDAGHPRVSFLPLAAAPESRMPEPQEPGENQPSLVFVGSCMVEQARKHRATLDALAAASGPQESNWRRFLAELDALANLVTEEPCRNDYESLLLSALARSGIPERLNTREGEIDLIVVAGESLAATKRVTLARALVDLGLVVRGEPAWAEVLPATCYQGPVGHGRDLTRIYSGAAINLDMNRLYQPDIVTLRTFEVAAAGGFLLTEDTAEIRELFAADREIVLYRDLADLRAKAAHYLQAHDERRSIAERFRARMMRDHRVDQRIKTMLEASAPFGGH